MRKKNDRYDIRSPDKFFRRQGAPEKARRRRSFLRRAAFEEQRSMRRNLTGDVFK